MNSNPISRVRKEVYLTDFNVRYKIYTTNMLAKARGRGEYESKKLKNINSFAFVDGGMLFDDGMQSV